VDSYSHCQEPFRAKGLIKITHCVQKPSGHCQQPYFSLWPAQGQHLANGVVKAAETGKAAQTQANT